MQATSPPSPNLFLFSFTERRLPSGRVRSTSTRTLPRSSTTARDNAPNVKSPTIDSFLPTLPPLRAPTPLTLRPSWHERNHQDSSAPSRPEGENMEKNLLLASWENRLVSDKANKKADNIDNANKKAGSIETSSSAGRPLERDDGSHVRVDSLTRSFTPLTLTLPEQVDSLTRSSSFTPGFSHKPTPPTSTFSPAGTLTRPRSRFEVRPTPHPRGGIEGDS